VDQRVPAAAAAAQRHRKIDKQLGKEAETIFNTLKALQEAYAAGVPPRDRPYAPDPGAPDGPEGAHRVRRTVRRCAPSFLSDIKRKFNLKKDTEEQPLIRRVALHAHALTFRLRNEEETTIEAPYPKDIAALVRQLEKNA
jgi:23S rRNA pseudouridine955/2504/2580 synthase